MLICCLVIVAPSSLHQPSFSSCPRIHQSGGIYSVGYSISVSSCSPCLGSILEVSNCFSQASNQKLGSRGDDMPIRYISSILGTLDSDASDDTGGYLIVLLVSCFGRTCRNHSNEFGGASGPRKGGNPTVDRAAIMTCTWITSMLPYRPLLLLPS